MNHVNIKTISLRQHPTLNEKWVQEVIAEDPNILGLGDIVLKDKERIVTSGGRLDLLFQEIEGTRRYEVELQLGQTDETHIIRTIEYWDLERRRYPQYDHVGVIIAENVTSRFLNVISLFNGFIPLVALQMTAIETKEGIGLHFTKVVDALRVGLVEEDEESLEVVDRHYWEGRGTAKTMKLVDEVYAICREIDSTVELKYNKMYIGLSRGGVAFNFCTMVPRKSAMNLTFRLPKDEAVDQELDAAGLDTLEYTRWGAYRLKLIPGDPQKHHDLLLKLLKASYDNRE
jgi:predicted transport protein